MAISTGLPQTGVRNVIQRTLVPHAQILAGRETLIGVIPAKPLNQILAHLLVSLRTFQISISLPNGQQIVPNTPEELANALAELRGTDGRRLINSQQSLTQVAYALYQKITNGILSPDRTNLIPIDAQTVQGMVLDSGNRQALYARYLEASRQNPNQLNLNVFTARRQTPPPVAPGTAHHAYATQQTTGVGENEPGVSGQTIVHNQFALMALLPEYIPNQVIRGAAEEARLGAA